MSSSEGDVAMKDPADKIMRITSEGCRAVKRSIKPGGSDCGCADALAGSAESERRGYKQARSSAESVVSILASRAMRRSIMPFAAALADTLKIRSATAIGGRRAPWVLGF